MCHWGRHPSLQFNRGRLLGGECSTGLFLQQFHQLPWSLHRIIRCGLRVFFFMVAAQLPGLNFLAAQQLLQGTQLSPHSKQQHAQLFGVGPFIISLMVGCVLQQ